MVTNGNKTYREVLDHTISNSSNERRLHGIKKNPSSHALYLIEKCSLRRVRITNSKSKFFSYSVSIINFRQFHKNLLMTKCSELTAAVFNGPASGPYDNRLCRLGSLTGIASEPIA